MRGLSRILAVAVLGFLCSACSVTRKIPEGQYLLQKVTIESDKSTPRKERITAADLEKYVRQTPNKRFLGTNFYVWLYAVSYTHLDVYKRQLEALSAGRRFR